MDCSYLGVEQRRWKECFQILLKLLHSEKKKKINKVSKDREKRVKEVRSSVLVIGAFM